MVVDWTNRAKQHLKSIFDYYAAVAGRGIAMKLVTDIRNTALPLVKFPEMAAIEPALADFPENFRSLVTRKNKQLIFISKLKRHNNG
jgi:plasmid stabilization system protein ParE